MQDFFFYLKLGWSHIIAFDALDHQLFILALVAVYAMKDLKKILILVTAFTIGHSLTLALSVLDLVRFPSNWVEFLIPVTISITAIGNILMFKNTEKLMKLNYFLALIFGLIHGMGFANSARMMIAREQNIFAPLLGFNIGLELGQIAIVLLILGFEFILFKYFKLNKKYWLIAVSSVALIFSLSMVLNRIPFS
ncbi:HupE/UreJ family protein [Halpernia frigidisoli]|uniref:HupE / UreJ protein n=1 Tax=Halpernia frigidisoli TaxID=1125876 RepID=A0A1I3FWN8_9FLAO|nr:HupE/UreJ family protein [Halpernia frigidisoli]SFI15604.1 HupE / UreJ protein [Halpernia frigidisoli]